MSDLLVPSRRGFLTGLGAILCAPAIVRVASLMPVKALPLDGFGLAAVKAEGSKVVYDFTPSMRAQLWPGIKYWFSEEYARTHQYEELFRPVDG